MPDWVDEDALRTKLEEGAPSLASAFFGLAEEWVRPALSLLDSQNLSDKFPKTFNDPVWGVVELLPWEVLLLDTPLLQRLRGVCQLGLAHFVYPGARHSRLEHSLGVVEAADRMIRALERNADHRRKFGPDSDEEIPQVQSFDRYTIRLAALLHDVGHGPFSHATESILHDRFPHEFRAIEETLRETYGGVTHIAAAESIAILLVMSPTMCEVFRHHAVGLELSERDRIAPAVVGRILGSRSCLKAQYLSGVVSGPLDADKLDYMVRDSHHSGLPVSIDVRRLVSKLEVIIVTASNAPTQHLRDRARAAPGSRFYEMGLSLAGLGAYEQMLVSRVMLYDRLYYHHKVRAAESLVRLLIREHEDQSDTALTVEDLFCPISDELFVARLSGGINDEDRDPLEPVESLRRTISNRSIYHRAFALAHRFVKGLSKLRQSHRDDTITILWPPVLERLDTQSGCRELATAIVEKAQAIAEVLDEFSSDSDIQEHEVIVDMPLKDAVVRGGDILTRTEDGQIGTPNLFFDPEKWSQAYEHQKQTGFVFCPKRRVPIVSLASTLVFWEEFRLAMNRDSRRACKTSDLHVEDWLIQLGKKEFCSLEDVEGLTSPRAVPYVYFVRDHIGIPQDLADNDPDLSARIVDELSDAFPTGVSSGTHDAVVKGIGHFLRLISLWESGGTFVDRGELSESEFQVEVRDGLRHQGADVIEGSEVSGGESDLLLDRRVVVENKVRGATKKPLEVGGKYPWQARRYSVAFAMDIGFVVLAYRPSDDAAILPLSSRIQINRLEAEGRPYVEIRVLVPWGHSVPSAAKVPRRRVPE